MYGVCLQTKPSETVHSFGCDKLMNAYRGQIQKSLVFVGLNDT